MHHLRDEIWKEQKQSAFEKDDSTINFNGFCGATLLGRREKSFEHNRNLFRDSERSRAATKPRTAFGVRPGFQIP